MTVAVNVCFLQKHSDHLLHVMKSRVDTPCRESYPECPLPSLINIFSELVQSRNSYQVIQRMVAIMEKNRFVLN
jgi:hypothetical protein